jgi:hypothetical protein
MIKEIAEDGTVVIQAPPPEGAETPEEGRARVRKWLNDQDFLSQP